MGVIKRQGIKNAIITYLGIIIGAVNIIFIQPRFLSEEELGLTRLLFDLAYLIGLAVPLGAPSIIVKYFPVFKDAKESRNSFVSFILILFFTGFLISTAVLLVFKPDITKFYEEESGLFSRFFIFLIPFSFIVSAITVTTAYCQSLFKSTVPSFLNDICIRIGVTIVTILYFNRVIGFDEYIYLFIGLYLIELMILMVFIRQTDRPKPVPAKDFFTRERVIPMIRFGLLLAVASFASMALRRIDAIVLGAASLKLVGVYTTAIFIAAFIEVPLGALERISHTRVSDCFARNDMQQVEKIYRDSVKYLLLAGGLLFILIVSCTRHIYELGNLPQSYSDCIGVVYIVGLGALINISTGTNSALLFYSSFYLSGTLWLIGTLILVLLLNLWLIPVYGIYGAAIASLTGSFVYNLMKFLFIFVKFGFQPYNRRSLLIAAIIAVIAAGGVLFPAITGNALVNLLIKGSILTISYLGVIYYMRLAPEMYSAAFNRIRSFTHKGRT